MATFTFYGNKILTSGEGGAITTDDPDLEARVRLFRGQGMDPDRRYYFAEVGYNYRLTNVACSILCAQLERADTMVRRRREIFDRYGAGLAQMVGVGFNPWPIGPSFHHGFTGSPSTQPHLDSTVTR